MDTNGCGPSAKSVHSDKPMGAKPPKGAKKPKMAPVLKASRDGDGDGTEKARRGGYIARNGGRGSMGSFPREKDAQQYANMREEHEQARSKLKPGDKAGVKALNDKAIEMQHFQGDNMLVPPKKSDWSGKNKKKDTGQRARYHLRGKKMAQSHMTKADLRKQLIGEQ